ncbi:MAG: hypothetical protein ACR2P7_01495 [bacterium]
MITPNFNTLTATQKLRDSGVAEPQAEAIVHEIVESQTDLTTKTDLAELKQSITIRLGAMMAATAGLILAGMSALLGLV